MARRPESPPPDAGMKASYRILISCPVNMPAPTGAGCFTSAFEHGLPDLLRQAQGDNLRLFASMSSLVLFRAV